MEFPVTEETVKKLSLLRLGRYGVYTTQWYDDISGYTDIQAVYPKYLVRPFTTHYDIYLLSTTGKEERIVYCADKNTVVWLLEE
jgi:hypothetical protein